ncbi:MAG: hypothetical protein INR71_16240, partial [Terriglobus roseus]|nr:hypothetical protein [Terriglobus roseus]
LPSPYLEPIQRRKPVQMLTSGSQAGGSPPGSRLQTMTNTAAGSGSAPGSRTQTMTGVQEAGKPEVTGKPGDIGVESFQKGHFYS